MLVKLPYITLSLAIVKYKNEQMQHGLSDWGAGESVVV